jgi:transmembrane 9 superfamily protein 2/4
MLAVGILPFGAIFIELFFIMNSLWSNRIYYMFGFLFLSFGLLVVTSAAVTIMMIYFILCAENYHWQWRAFASSGASAGYVFTYSLLYWARMLSFSSLTGGLLYLGYSALISFLWFVMTGKSSISVAFQFQSRVLTMILQAPSASGRVGCLCIGYTAPLRLIKRLAFCFSM